MMVEEVAGIWTIVARKRLPNNNVVKFRRQAWTVLPELPAYVGRRFITYYMTTKGKQLSFIKMDLEQQGKLTEDIFCKEIVRQCITAADNSPVSWTMIMFIIIGAVAGVPVGMILGPMIGINLEG